MTEIRRQLDRYLTGDVALDDLETWLEAEMWDDPAQPAVAADALRLVAEYENGDWPLAEFMQKLAALVAGNPSRLLVVGTRIHGNTTTDEEVGVRIGDLGE